MSNGDPGTALLIEDYIFSSVSFFILAFLSTTYILAFKRIGFKLELWATMTLFFYWLTTILQSLQWIIYLA